MPANHCPRCERTNLIHEIRISRQYFAKRERWICGDCHTQWTQPVRVEIS